MLLNTIRSEWLKIRSTKSVYWTTVLVAVIVWGLGAIMAWASGFSLQTALDDGEIGHFISSRRAPGRRRRSCDD